MAHRIWLCADDYGLAPGVNAAICALIRERQINATSVMTAAPNLNDKAVAALLQAAGQASAAIGLHVTLTAPHRPLTASFRPLHGEVFPPLSQMLARALLRRLDRAALATEIEAQFEAFARAFGRPPDFADGHQHVQLFPQVRDAFLAAAQRRAPRAWVRQCGNPSAPARASDPKALLLNRLSANFRRRAAARGIRTNAAFSGTYVFDAKADFATLFPRFLNGLPDASVVMCHPGTVDAELARLDPVTHLRAREYAYLAGDEPGEALRRAGLELF